MSVPNLPELPQSAGTTSNEAWHPPTHLDVVKHLGAYSRELDAATLNAEQVGQEYAYAKHRYRVAYAEAWLTATGTQEARKQTAILAVEDECFHMEATEQKLKAAKDRVETLRTQISTGQTIHRGVMQEMNAAGLVNP
ncbi:hypothetical protein ACWFMI_24745 [Nocardiopsis terrae]|uniref:hypothetical protein n=1 Tax=Streptomyces sp. NPDC057554 TaxID=3350538 RepID=UPI00367A8656